MASRYYLNHNYFEDIDCEEKAYFIGFLMADGYITTRKSDEFGEKIYDTVGLHLNKSDICILDRFKECVESNHTIFIGKRFNDCAIRFKSIKMVEDLAKYGIVPKKTGTERLILDNIDPIYYRHIVRGLVDGDGWISFGHSEVLDKDISSIGICGSYDICDFVQNYFHDVIGTGNLNVSKVKDKDCYKIGYSSMSDQIKIAKHLYDGATIYLPRKYKLAKTLF